MTAATSLFMPASGASLAASLTSASVSALSCTRGAMMISGARHTCPLFSNLPPIIRLAVVTGSAPLRDDHGRFATQFQRHRSEIVRRGMQDMARGSLAAGVNQVIERQFAERPRHFHAAGCDMQFVRIEALLDKMRKEVRRGRRMLGGLEHRDIAGSKNPGQRGQHQIDREVPRPDHTHHAKRLILHLRAGTQEPQRQPRNRVLRLSSFIQRRTLRRACASICWVTNTSAIRLWVARACAIILRNGIAQRMAMLRQQCDQSAQSVTAQLCIRKGLRARSCMQSLELLAKCIAGERCWRTWPYSSAFEPQLVGMQSVVQQAHILPDTRIVSNYPHIPLAQRPRGQLAFQAVPAERQGSGEYHGQSSCGAWHWGD